MKAAIFWVFLALVALLAPPAQAAEKDTFGHGLQFGLRAGLVGGYNMIFRYDQSPLCASYDTNKQLKDQQKFCGHAAPLSLDLAASFAPLDFVEPYVFVRLGLAGETQTDTAPIQVVGAGARIYTMSDSAFKIFIEPALAYEFEGSAGKASRAGYDPQYKGDMLIHLAAGPQLDIARYVGVFANAGLTTGIFRAIHTQLELQLGVQARFPDLAMSARPFRILGVQQIAIGALRNEALLELWSGLFGLEVRGRFESATENVSEVILELGLGPARVELDLMQPLDPDAKPKVHEPTLNHLGLWVDDLHAAHRWLSAQGVRFTPGGVRKGAAGHDVCFVHPKPSPDAPRSGEGVLIELVQAPPTVLAAFAALAP